jgi:hypothetical protein
MKATAFWIHHLLRFDAFDPKLSTWSPKIKLGSALHTLGHRISHWMFEGEEPHISKTTDRAGHTVWHVYDPVSNVHANFDNESSVRRWLENRYNEPTPAIELVVLR